MSRYYHTYLLDENGDPYPVEDDWSRESLEKIQELYKNAEKRRVARTYITDTIYVSTVFLVENHQFDPDDPRPILYETMVFGFGDTDLCLRAYTKEEAQQNHDKVVGDMRLNFN